ncbi:MAG TPA: lipid II flippase MurJ [Acidimicrobiales bacterium]|nr:lipid II flippase MurJ [Acidimicrobiales bacterium]
MVDTIEAPTRRRHLFTSTLTITALTVAARLAIALRDILVARQFGVSSNVDAFFIALALPTLLAVAISGALQTAVVPAEVEFREIGRPANDLLVPLVRALGKWLVLVAALIGLLAWPIVHLLGSGFDDATASTARGLLCLVAVIVVLSGVSGVLSGGLASQRRFGLAVSGQVLNGVTAVVCFIAFHGALGITAAALGVVLGHVVEVTWLSVASGVRVPAIFSGRADAQQRAAANAALRSAAPLLVATLLTSANTVIDQGFAAALPSGSVAALGYASKLVLFAGIPLAAVSLAAFPSLSELASRGDVERLRHQVLLRGMQIVVLGAVLAVGVVVAGWLLLDHVLTSSSATSVSAITGTLAAYAVMLPAYGAGILLARVLTAVGRSRWVMVVAGFNAVLNCVGDWWLREVFGLKGIAMSTALVQTVSCLVLAALLSAALRPSTDPTRT